MGIHSAAARTIAVPDLVGLVVIIAGAAATYTLGKPNPPRVRPQGRQSR